MPRIAGQIDLAKNEAILDAAGEAFAERGLAVGLNEIARRAGVSKQTIYNHYGCKAELVRGIVERRLREITAPLDMPGAVENPEEALVALGQEMLSGVFTRPSQRLMKLSVISATGMPEIGAAFYEAGPQASRARLAKFLAEEDMAGRLMIPDPMEAASFFLGMLLGPHQMPSLLGLLEDFGPAEIEASAREVAKRFMRAYAP